MPRFHLVLLVAIAIMAPPLAATVVVPAEFHAVVADATLIVRGSVSDVRSVAAAEGGIDSIATVAVTSRLKGTADAFIFVRLPGGVIGRDRFVMVGAPTLRLHDDAVFFLKRGPDQSYHPVGLSSGIVRVHSDPITGQPMVAAPVLLGITASVGPVVRGDTRRGPIAVSTFESMVRLAMAGATSRRAVHR